MTIKTSARSVLILATGLFVCFAGPSPAATGADNAATDSKSASSESDNAAEESVALNKYAKHGSRQWKRHAHRKSGRVALKSSTGTGKKADATDVAAEDGAISTAIPLWVVNARAQMASTNADTPDGNARAMSTRANDILQAAPDNLADAQPATDAKVVASEQLNDLDRALQASTSPAPTPETASADAPVASSDAPAASSDAAVASVAESSNESSWDKATLIGKIFIGFGALLTVASAARMFMM